MPNAITENTNVSARSRMIRAANNSGDAAKSELDARRSVMIFQPPRRARRSAKRRAPLPSTSGDPTEIGLLIDVENDPRIIALDQNNGVRMPLQDGFCAAVPRQSRELSTERR